MEAIRYKGKGEHSINELELIIEQKMEELYLINSGQKQLRIGSASQQRELLIGYIINEQRLYCGKPDRKLSEDLADDYIANL